MAQTYLKNGYVLSMDANDTVYDGGGVDLAFLRLLGWFVLAIYIINEVTSILENMVALGVDVPPILLKGLSAAKTAVDAAGNKVVPENSTEKKSE